MADDLLPSRALTRLASPVTSLRKSLLLIALAVACSRERQPAAGAKGGPKDASAAGAAVKANAPPVPPKPVAPVPKLFAGAYVRGSDSSIFRPCGETKYYLMRERGEARSLLRERFYWTARFIGLPMYAVFHGFFFDDSLKAPAGDKAASAGSSAPKLTVVKRFMLTRVDSLRTYESSTDCRGARSAK
jgi:hypothetical protein